jgi:hypothetical protein
MAPSAGWFQVENAVFDHGAELLGANGLLVYCCLLRHQNSKGECWPSMPTLARKCGLSRATVARAIAHLRENGAVSVLSGGTGRANVYRIHPIFGEVPVSQGDGHLPHREVPISQGDGYPSHRETGVVSQRDPNNTHEQNLEKNTHLETTSFFQNDAARGEFEEDEISFSQTFSGATDREASDSQRRHFYAEDTLLAAFPESFRESWRGFLESCEDLGEPKDSAARCGLLRMLLRKQAEGFDPEAALDVAVAHGRPIPIFT